jgi:hypothetical protein
VIRLFHVSTVLRATAGQTNKDLSWIKIWAHVVLSVVNFFFMLIADIVYVMTIINANIGVAILAQFILALVKIGWNNSILWKLLIWCDKWVSYLYSPCCRSPLLHDENLLDHNANDVGMISTSIGLNNLIYPILAIMAVSTNCLHDAVVQPPLITSSYSGEEITELGSAAMMTVSTSYNPPFSYGYQCSSVIYAYYTPVFIIMFTFELVVIPIIQLSLRFYFENSSDKKVRYSAIKMVNNVGGGVEEENDENDLADSVEAISSRGKSDDVKGLSGKSTSTFGYFCFPPVHKLLPNTLQDLETPEEIVLLSTSYSIKGKKSASSDLSSFPSLPFFNQNRYVVKFISAFLIIVSYGTVFPPLAIIGTISVIFRTIYEETVLGRVLYEASEKRCFEYYEKQLQKDCKGIVHPIRYCLVIILPISTLLFSYLIFDTFNTTVKTDLALLPLISFFLLTIGITYFAAKGGFQRRRRRQEREVILENVQETGFADEGLLSNLL